MASLFENISTVATGFFGWFETVINFIISEPLLLAFCSLAVLSLVVSLVLRFVHGVN